MDLLINPAGTLHGRIKSPPSKSYTHRALVISCLNEKATIVNPLHSKATYWMKEACESFGAEIIDETKEWKIRGFKELRSAGKIDVGNSGTALRLSISLAALASDGGKTIVTGDASLCNRPNKPLVDALQDLGGDIEGTGPDHNAPITIIGNGLKGGTTTISGSKSSQFISSLLLACPKAQSDTEINVSGQLVSKPYVRMTLDLLNQAEIEVKNSQDLQHFFVPAGQKYKSLGEYHIYGDYSQAAFFLAAASLVDADVIVEDLRDDKQGDRRIVQILKDMGVDIRQYDSSVRVKGPSDMHGVEIDLCDTPDLFPILAVLAMFSKGITRLYNIPQIRYKESDRIAVLKREFVKLGAKIEDKHDEMIIHPQNKLTCGNCTLDPRGEYDVPDHRIALALSILGLKVGKAVVKDGDCVEVSFPTFVRDMNNLGANMRYMS